MAFHKKRDIAMPKGSGDYDADRRDFDSFMADVGDVMKWGKICKEHIRNMRLRVYAKAVETIHYQQIMRGPNLPKGKLLRKYVADNRRRRQFLKQMHSAVKIVRNLCESQCRWVIRLEKTANLKSVRSVFLNEKIEFRKLLSIMVHEQRDCLLILEERIQQLCQPIVEETLKF